MELITALQATAIVDAVVDLITANAAGLVIVIGAMAGIALFRKFFRSSIKRGTI